MTKQNEPMDSHESGPKVELQTGSKVLKLLNLKLASVQRQHSHSNFTFDCIAANSISNSLFRPSEAMQIFVDVT